MLPDWFGNKFGWVSEKLRELGVKKGRRDGDEDTIK
jgi:hypothetical protein